MMPLWAAFGIGMVVGAIAIIVVAAFSGPEY